MCVPIVLMVWIACSSPPPKTNSPLSGTIGGTSFELLGSYAEARNGAIYVTLANTVSSCTSFLQPGASVLRVDVTLPQQSQTTGSYVIGSGASSPHVAVTWFSSATDGTLRQNSTILENGTVDLYSIDPELSGAIGVTGSGIMLLGIFSAPLCQ